jgi:hypothetical protein
MAPKERKPERQLTGLRLLRDNCTRDYQVTLLKVKTLYKWLGSERHDIQSLLVTCDLYRDLGPEFFPKALL